MLCDLLTTYALNTPFFVYHFSKTVRDCSIPKDCRKASMFMIKTLQIWVFTSFANMKTFSFCGTKSITILTFSIYVFLSNCWKDQAIFIDMNSFKHT